MIGIVIVTHCCLGDALIEAAVFILGSRPEQLESISIDLNEQAEKLRAKIPESKVVMLSTYDNPTYIARAVALGAALHRPAFVAVPAIFLRTRR